MSDPDPTLFPRSRFWRRFDRWALVVVVVLQAAILAARWRKGHEAGPTPPAAAETDVPAAIATRQSEGFPPVARRRPVVAAAPVCYGAADPLRAPLSVDSVCSMAAWDVLRRSPALDVREHQGEYELRLSIPGGESSDARAWVEDRQVEIEVPVADALGQPTGRLVRRVLLPAAPDSAIPPRIEHTNGILRVFFAKP
jgi:hypothetical protein